MSDLIIKKNGTDYKLPMLAEHYPADRVYLDGDINKTVQDALSISSGVVTFDSNWGGSIAALKKVGHVCTLWMRYQTGLSTDFTNGVIAHVPAEFFPNDNICIPCVKLDSSGINVTGSGYLVLLNNATGDVAYYGDPFHFQEFIQVNGSWIIS